MKKILSIALVLCVLFSFAACGKAESKTLNLYTWAETFPQEVLDGFTEKTGIKVNYVNFDYDETMLMKLQQAKGGDYDVIIADDYIIETVIAEGLAQPLDKSKITNYNNINPVFQGQFYDPKDEYTVPYGAGIQTIVYNPDKVDIDIKGYADLWDSSLENRVGIIGNFRVINGMALKVLGESYNTNDLDLINKAGEKLNELAPNIRLIKDDYINDDLLSGEIDAAVMYTSQVTMAKLANPNLKVVFPTEGVGFGIMGMFIPSKAPNADAAHKFIDYILDAQVGADCYEWLGYYSTNSASDALIHDEYKEFLTLPTDLDYSTMEMIGNISQEAMDAHDAAWSAFRDKCE